MAWQIKFKLSIQFILKILWYVEIVVCRNVESYLSLFMLKIKNILYIHFFQYKSPLRRCCRPPANKTEHSSCFMKHDWQTTVCPVVQTEVSYGLEDFRDTPLTLPQRVLHKGSFAHPWGALQPFNIWPDPVSVPSFGKVKTLPSDHDTMVNQCLCWLEWQTELRNSFNVIKPRQ